MDPLIEVLQRQAAQLGDRVAAKDGAARLAFGQLPRIVDEITATLDEAGIPIGAPVYVDSADRNWCSYLAAFLGLAGSRRIPVLAPFGAAPIGRLARLSVQTATHFEATVTAAAADEAPAITGHFLHPLDIVLSSGSTGQPKAYLFDQSHFIDMEAMRSPRHELRAMHFGIPFPTSTGAHAIAIRHLVGGITSIHTAVPADRSDLFAAFDQHQPFELGSTPFALSPLFAEASRPARTAPRQVRVYAGPLSDTLAGNLVAVLPGCRVVSIYGTTETGNVTLTRNGTGSRFSLAPERARLWLAAQSRDAGPGELGEILMRVEQGGGAPLLLDPTRPARPDIPAGWVRTGDLGRLEPDGTVAFVGRSNDLVLHGGDRRSALALEQELEKLGLHQALVFGANLHGDEHLTVLLEASSAPAPTTLGDLAGKAGCSCAAIVSSFPRTALGKVRKPEAVAAAVAAMTAPGAKPAAAGGILLYDLRQSS